MHRPLVCAPLEVVVAVHVLDQHGSATPGNVVPRGRIAAHFLRAITADNHLRERVEECTPALTT